MQQKIYRLFLDKSVLGTAEKKELKHYCEEMKELAEKLSQGFPELRVDLYNVQGKIYFGEITFFHWSGMKPFKPVEWDYTFGSWIKFHFFTLF